MTKTWSTTGYSARPRNYLTSRSHAHRVQCRRVGPACARRDAAPAGADRRKDRPNLRHERPDRRPELSPYTLTRWALERRRRFGISGGHMPARLDVGNESDQRGASGPDASARLRTRRDEVRTSCRLVALSSIGPHNDPSYAR